jgi:hypothetical protein
VDKIEIIETELLAADLQEPPFEQLEGVLPDAYVSLIEQEPLEDLSVLVLVDASDFAEWLDCPAGDPRPSRWRHPIRALAAGIDALLAALGQSVRALARTGLLVLHTFLSILLMIIKLPWHILSWIVAAPGRIVYWVVHWDWAEMLTVRKGFLFGALGGFLVGTSSIWALSSMPYLPGHPIEPVVLAPRDVSVARLTVPAELAWFFIQFPYISEKAQVRIKNHHTFVVADNSRKKEYVVTLGQKFRRVEIYAQDNKANAQVQIFTPGSKRTVWFDGSKIVGQAQVSDGNLWMWRGPLWNSVHLKIYGLADLWLDSPYKKYSCAGFVHKFLGDAGVHVPILDAWDIAKQPWMRVSVEEMEPGDVITIKALTASHRRFWHHRITHVGVYIGHGKFIHAATFSPSATRSWVRIADVEDFRPRIDKVLRPPELQ